jgi:hypothetical protein
VRCVKKNLATLRLTSNSPGAILLLVGGEPTRNHVVSVNLKSIGIKRVGIIQGDQCYDYYFLKSIGIKRVGIIQGDQCNDYFFPEIDRNNAQGSSKGVNVMITIFCDVGHF